MAVASALAASGVAVATERPPVRTFAADDGEAPWWMLSPLGPGALLANGWTIATLSRVRKGAAVLVLEHPVEGAIEVHLCAHDGTPRGVVSTELVDLVVMDGGRGDKRTDESLGRVLMDLGARIRRNEVRGDADLRPLAEMRPHADRVAEYGPENL